MANPPLTPAENLCFALYSASHAMSRLYRPLLEPLDLTYPQYLVMLSLWNENPQRVGDLGRNVALDSNTLTPLLKRMEKAGFLTRRRGTEDERVTLVALTEKGERLKQEARHIHACMLKATGLSEEEANSLRLEVRGLIDRLTKSVTNP